jgi:hypothetical protein
MPLYEMTPDSFRPLDEGSFAGWKVSERGDLQRLLRTQIEVLDDDLYVIAEEFSDWEDSRRRIDLLAIDSGANLVVIELKRTSDGGHMELQTIRYASMVSTMTFERAERIHGDFLRALGQPPEEARSRMLAFLGWDEPDEEAFAQDVRILLVSEDFGKELTTAVLWLRERDIDIRCVRLRPYQDGGKRLIDVQQIIPLPEANDYQVQLREKEQLSRREKAGQHEVFVRYWAGLQQIARQKGTRHANLKAGSRKSLSAGSGKSGLSFNYVIVKEAADIELYIDCRDTERNKRIFDQLHSKKDEVENAFGGDLIWQRLDSGQASRIKHTVEGGYKASESEWPVIHAKMVDAMIRLEGAIRPFLEQLD